jgi:tetratricopeptide (TPR) repeat protein
VRPTLLFVFAAFTVAGCAAHHGSGIADRFVREGNPSVHWGEERDANGAPEDSLAIYMEKIRQLSLAIRPLSSGTAGTVEASNPDLAGALAREAAAPSAETHRAVGEIYRKLGLLDSAYAHFARAIKADGRNAATYEQMARLWRDWGFPHIGLGDAYRAVYWAPRSPSAQNTLGTLLQALDQPAEAVVAYRRALALAPDAPYALNNVCSALLAMRQPKEALAACQRAVQLDPTLVVAQRNLAQATATEDPGSAIPIAQLKSTTLDLDR